MPLQGWKMVDHIYVEQRIILNTSVTTSYAWLKVLWQGVVGWQSKEINQVTPFHRTILNYAFRLGQAP